MFQNEFPPELANLKAIPFDKAHERSQVDVDAALTSGRNQDENVDLLENLVATLEDRWETDEFETLPSSIRLNILNTVRRVNSAAGQYAVYQTTPQEFENQVDALHSILYTNNFLEVTKERRLYESRNNQLERLKRKGRRIINELEEAIEKTGEIEAADERAQAAAKSAELSETEAGTRVTEIERLRVEAESKLAITQQKSDEATRIESLINDTKIRIDGSESEISGQKESIRLFYDEIEQNRKKLDTAVSNSKTRIEGLEDRSEKIVKRHEKLNDRVEEQLQKAASGSLFQAFDSRQKVLTKSKWIWAAISIFSIIGTVV